MSSPFPLRDTLVNYEISYPSRSLSLFLSLDLRYSYLFLILYLFNSISLIYFWRPESCYCKEIANDGDVDKTFSLAGLVRYK